jgi:hypothetical protein
VAKGGHILPADAQVHGYSLERAARELASFNTGPRSDPPPFTPFKVIYLDLVTNNLHFEVAPDTTLYVPVMYNDTSLPIVGDFPADASNRFDLIRYWYSQSQFGVTEASIIVDGVATALGGTYLVGLNFSGNPLPDEAEQYGTIAAFVSPLSRGRHTIEIRSRATGDGMRSDELQKFFPDGTGEFITVYTVDVK